MTDLTIEREIVIDAPADVVWRTITEPDQIALWFADRVDLDLEPGRDGALHFEDGSEVITARLVVETVDPPHRFSYRWAHPEGDVPRAGNSVLVEFTLSAESAGRTRLRVVETGLDAIGWPEEDKARFADEHRDGWAIHLGRLSGLFATAAG